MKNWREDAQPEWPAAASPTRDSPVVGAGSQSLSGIGGTPLASLAGDSTRYRSLLDLSSENALLPAPAGSNGVSENERSSDLRDPWEEPADGPDATANDPGEVTVQLDSLKKGRPDADAASDVPVFVDESGRRSRTFRRIGILVGIACGAYAVVIVAALLSGNAGAPWLPIPVPGHADEKPSAGNVDSPSSPDASASPGREGSGRREPGAPDVTATATAAVPGRPGASASPGASGSAAPSGGASPAARSSASGTARPSTGPTASAPAVGASTPVVAPPASTPPPPPSSPAASPSVASSPSPAGGASTTVADGPQAPVPAASGPAA
ncbi:translation initiation factor IF-2 [Streptomyces asoensis]|uniref:translation initiation factor IF-2 n=1 Tax=Streptomyces asoensis TaxID=249586 RepID=UPI003404A97F